MKIMEWDYRRDNMTGELMELLEKYEIELDIENEETIGDDNMMSIEDKVKLTDFIQKMRRTACNWEHYYDMECLKNELKGLFRCQSKEARLSKEYKFFKGLHKQSDIDNIISLSKIVTRLDVETPKVKLDFNNIEKTYDEIWNDINNQIPFSIEDFEWATELAKDILYNIENFEVGDNIKYQMMKICMRFLNEDYANYITPLTQEYFILVPTHLFNGEQMYSHQFIRF